MRRAFPLLTLFALLFCALPVQAHGFGYGRSFSYGAFSSPVYSSAFAYPSAQLVFPVAPVQTIYLQPQAIYAAPAVVAAPQAYAAPVVTPLQAPAVVSTPVVQQEVLPVLAPVVVSYLQSLAIVDRCNYLHQHYGASAAFRLHERHFGPVSAAVRQRFQAPRHK